MVMTSLNNENDPKSIKKTAIKVVLNILILFTGISVNKLSTVQSGSVLFLQSITV